MKLRIYTFNAEDRERAAAAVDNLGFDWYVKGTVAVGPLGPGTTPVIHALDG